MRGGSKWRSIAGFLGGRAWSTSIVNSGPPKKESSTATPFYLRRVDAMSNCVSTGSQIVGGATGRVHLGSCGVYERESA
jgi:hypothetical protein